MILLMALWRRVMIDSPAFSPSLPSAAPWTPVVHGHRAYQPMDHHFLWFNPPFSQFWFLNAKKGL